MAERPTGRRGFLAGASAAVCSLAAGCSGRQWEQNSDQRSRNQGSIEVGLTEVVSDLGFPVALENPLKDHIFIADRGGYVVHIDASDGSRDEVLDLSDEIVTEHGEQGVLGLEFHPDFERNKKFYVRYSSPSREGTPESYSHTFVLSEFRMQNDFEGVVPDSERAVLEIPEPGRMHNAGAIEFGPDGYLYVTLGDGGGDGHDGSGPLNLGQGKHAGDWYWWNIGGNGQDISSNLLGSVIRIDVDSRDGEKPYGVPEDNPLTEASEGLREHYAWGFRNPYSMSFSGDDLFLADVGTRAFEEVNLIEGGGNYGWNVREGFSCHNNFPPLRALSMVGVDIDSLPACPAATSAGENLIDPVITYRHLPGGAIIGGNVYTRTSPSNINGKYVFGDLRGRLFASRPSGGDKPWSYQQVQVGTGGETTESLGAALLSIETGFQGEMFLLTTDGESGRVLRIDERGV